MLALRSNPAFGPHLTHVSALSPTGFKHVWSSLEIPVDREIALSPNQDGAAPPLVAYTINRSSENFNYVVNLITEKFSNNWEWGSFLGKLKTTYNSSLINQIPEQDQSQCLLISLFFHKETSNVFGEATEHFFSKDEISILECFKIPNNNENISELQKALAKAYEQQGYSDLWKAVSRRIEELMNARNEMADPERADEILTQILKILNWQMRLLAGLKGVGVSPDESQRLQFLAVRLQGIADINLRERLTEMLLHHLFLDKKSLDRLEQRVGGNQITMKAPSLHAIVLNELQRRDVDKDLLARINQRLVSMETSIFEGVVNGKNLLKGMLDLMLVTGLSPDDHHTILERLFSKERSKEQLLQQLTSISQLVAFGTSNFIKISILEKYDYDLSAIAQKVFIMLIPIPDIEDFQAKYEQHVLSQRRSEALTAYASKISGIPDVMEIFAAAVYECLEGRFPAVRYMEEHNNHLQRVYQKTPRLKEQWPKIPQEMQSKKVREFAVEDSDWVFPLRKGELIEIVINDQHLDHGRFPYLVCYLNDQEYRELYSKKKTLAKENKKAKTITDEQRIQFLELELQAYCIDLCNDKKGGNALRFILKKLGRVIN